MDQREGILQVMAEIVHVVPCRMIAKEVLHAITARRVDSHGLGYPLHRCFEKVCGCKILVHVRETFALLREKGTELWAIMLPLEGFPRIPYVVVGGIAWAGVRPPGCGAGVRKVQD